MALTKTEKGQLAFKTRSPELSAKQRSAFIFFDGKRSIPDVLAATAGLGITPADIAGLVTGGMLEETGPSLSFQASAPSVAFQQTQATSAPIAPSASTPQ